MAEYEVYKCEKCGYQVEANPLGHDTLMDGEYYDFWCHECNEIVSINVEDMYKQGMYIRCPECEKEGLLSTWNPIKGHCPKCNSRLKPTGERVMAD